MLFTQQKNFSVNPLIPTSDENENSLYIITACCDENKGKITNDVLTFRQILLTSSIPNLWKQCGEYAFSHQGLKGQNTVGLFINGD